MWLCVLIGAHVSYLTYIRTYACTYVCTYVHAEMAREITVMQWQNTVNHKKMHPQLPVDLVIISFHVDGFNILGTHTHTHKHATHACTHAHTHTKTCNRWFIN